MLSRSLINAVLFVTFLLFIAAPSALSRPQADWTASGSILQSWGGSLPQIGVPSYYQRQWDTNSVYNSNYAPYRSGYWY
ncbi:hypothetical protein AAVH_25764 [Aphelenchoides avenae]|nr:hypothetical protein AAVH_25764 [Aphelenchus avenae]